MKKNLFCIWLACLAILFSVNTQAQMTIGGKKEPEKFSALEILNIGGVRMPQMTTAQRNAFAIQPNNVKGEGLTIYNIDTKCIEYWNATRWVSLCEGTSQTTISPKPCVNVAADGTGCDQTFVVTDPDCLNGPFNIAIVAGGDYADLVDVDNVNGKFKIAFRQNETTSVHTVLVRVTSTCTSLYKEFLFSQNGVDCSSMSYSVPAISPSAASLTLCAGGAVYLSVPGNTANLDKLIWTRNGVPVARGVNYYVATQRGEYNISMGAVGCNTNDSNKRTITESGSVTPVKLIVSASNNGVICGSGKVILSASGSNIGIAWFHNGIEAGTGASIEISGDSSVGEWFAATKDGKCYSLPSASIMVAKSEATGQVSLPAADVLVNGVRLDAFTTFCAGGILDLSVANKIAGITYTWYNGDNAITTNPFLVPDYQTKISLRVIATDNSGAKCPAEASVLEKDIIKGNTPSKPTINSTTTLCNGQAVLTILETGIYTWYKDDVKITDETSKELIVKSGGIYAATITNATGCVSPKSTITISGDATSPNLSWFTDPPATAVFGSSVTFVTNTQPYPTTYVWTMDGVKLSNTGQTATIKLPGAGASVKIAVTATNSCGNQTLEKTINLGTGCPMPVITSDPVGQTIAAKTNVTLAIAVKDVNAETYQWYRNTTDSTTGGAEVTPGGKGVSYSTSDLDIGTYYFYCIVKNGCDGNPTAVSKIAKVTVNKNPADITSGSGALTGKTCFDVVEINNSNECGTLVSRLSQKSDFSKPDVNTQKYTFTPQGTVTKVRFEYIENPGAGKIVADFIDNKDNTVTVKYKPELQNTAKGLAAKDAFKLTIYAIYTDGTGIEKAVQLTAQIKDCACCGAMISPTVWKEFMCHNLGADQSLDPFIPQAGIVGSYYMWGRSTPGGGTANKNALAWYNNGKTANDPCPNGYRIPNDVEWSGVIANNTITLKGVLSASTLGSAGIQIGPNLMLPAAGVLQDGLAPTVALFATSYWGSKSNGSSGNALYSLVGTPMSFYYGAYNWDHGLSIRCISSN